jgi:hypothetical protein
MIRESLLSRNHRWNTTFIFREIKTKGKKLRLSLIGLRAIKVAVKEIADAVQEMNAIQLHTLGSHMQESISLKILVESQSLISQ